MKCEITDNPSLVIGLDQVCFPDDKRIKVQEGDTWWILWSGGSPVAYAGSRPCDGDTAIFLCRAGVLPGHRGNGYQRKLIRRRLKNAEALGVEAAITYTLPENIYSSNNLFSCGLQLYRPDYLWVGRDALYFRKVFK